MSYRCKFSKVGRQVGHRVSHANNKTKHVFKANLQDKKLFIPELNKMVRVKVSTRVLRTIDKLGIKATMAKYGMSMKDLARA